jgi:hypothetical protein
MAEIRIYSGGAPKEALAILTPQYERRTGHRITYRYAVIAELQQRLATGETPDMVIMPVPALDALLKTGVLKRTALAVFGGVGISVIVRRRAHISTRSFQSRAFGRTFDRSCPSERDAGRFHLAKVGGAWDRRRAARQAQSLQRARRRRGADPPRAGRHRHLSGERSHRREGVALVGLLPPALQSLIIWRGRARQKRGRDRRRRSSLSHRPAHQPVWKAASRALISDAAAAGSPGPRANVSAVIRGAAVESR